MIIKFKLKTNRKNKNLHKIWPDKIQDLNIGSKIGGKFAVLNCLSNANALRETTNCVWSNKIYKKRPMQLMRSCNFLTWFSWVITDAIHRSTWLSFQYQFNCLLFGYLHQIVAPYSSPSNKALQGVPPSSEISTVFRSAYDSHRLFSVWKSFPILVLDLHWSALLASYERYSSLYSPHCYNEQSVPTSWWQINGWRSFVSNMVVAVWQHWLGCYTFIAPQCAWHFAQRVPLPGYKT